MLEKELEIFNKKKSELKSQHSEGYVVIKGEDILGVWKDRRDALRAGIEAYGNISFLVKNITDEYNVINFSRNLKFA